MLIEKNLYESIEVIVCSKWIVYRNAGHLDKVARQEETATSEFTGTTLIKTIKTNPIAASESAVRGDDFGSTTPFDENNPFISVNAYFLLSTDS